MDLTWGISIYVIEFRFLQVYPVHDNFMNKRRGLTHVRTLHHIINML